MPRLWLDGEGFRSIERLSQVDRKTVRRYVTAAEELGLVRDGGVARLGDEFIAAVVEVVRPHRSDGHGGAWRQLVAFELADQVVTLEAMRYQDSKVDIARLHRGVARPRVV